MALAHPSTVSFAGMSGGLLGFSFSPGQAGIQDVTTFASSMQNGRLIRDYECISIDSGTATVRLLGSPGFSRTSIGTRGTLSVSTPGGSGSADAILRSFTIEAEVGDLVRGVAEFTTVGN